MKPLKDYLPELKKIEGFPIGEDEDILALSNPPYYTACPNPYIKDFIKEHGTPYDEETDDYHREPFVEDVSFGKNHPIYTAHTYHTKVPHQAIMKYIEHYTNEGDIVFDGFCGTGMTGIAAQLMNRKAILSDLSPIATFIASVYNSPHNVAKFEKQIIEILDELESEFGWLYHTKHVEKTKGATQLSLDNKFEEKNGIINFVVWSDVLSCPLCKNEYIFWEVALDNEKGKVKDLYTCPNCSAEISKKTSERVFKTVYDEGLSKNTERAIQVPVLINYTWNKKRFNKKPDQLDFDLLDKIERFDVPYWYPIDELPNGENTVQPKRSHGMSNVHQFFTKRNLIALSALLSKVGKKRERLFLFLFTGILNRSTQMNRIHVKNYFFGGGGWNAGYLKKTLYVSSIPIETSIFSQIKSRKKSISRAFKTISFNQNNYNIINNGDAGKIENIPSNSIDYIFTDPPFGRNIMYSELNFMWEAWLKVKTNNKNEAIINKVQQKELSEYFDLMNKSFQEFYRVLKPKRWITVEFSNSKSSVWNVIQDALTKAGFVVVNVSVLDKKQGSFKQVTTSGSVKSDLVISAYKPSQKFAERFLSQAGENMEIDFVREFLHNLPKEPVMERTDKMLYNKMLSQYIIRGYEIRYNASSFYQMLGNYFVEEDGYWFNENQLPAYRGWKQKMHLEGMDEVQSGQRMLFVSDEKSALVWLYNFISIPKSLGDIHAAFRKIANITDDTLPELKELLSENFILEEGKYRRPTSNEEKSAINEKRERQLMREFESLLLEAKNSKRKIKQVRKEALSLGFETCYRQKRFADILALAKKLNKRILENNAELNDYVEIAEIKVEGL